MKVVASLVVPVLMLASTVACATSAFLFLLLISR